MKKILPPILVLLLCHIQSSAAVSQVNASYQSGQVFITWNNISNTNAYYKVYRSNTAINYGSQLSGCEYLGLTNSKSAIDNNLTQHDNIDRYLHITSSAPALTSGTGLFVATTLVNGSYYYAVTTLIDGTEDTTIIQGSNSTVSAVDEWVMKPQPVLQETRTISGKPVEIYTLFVSSKFDVTRSPWLKAGFLPFDFAVYRNNAVANAPLKIFLHPGGGSFLDDITTTTADEINLYPEDYYPDELVDPAWWGSNENFDVYNDANNATPPTSGINYNYTQLRLSAIIDWAIRALPVDSNRIYLRSNSQGSPGAYLYTITYPERIAAAQFANGIFNLTYDNDWQTNCTFNTGKKNRKKVDQRMGDLASNLQTFIELNTNQVFNGAWMIHNNQQRDLPVIYSINGKNDLLMGWTEKTIYYDSVDQNHCGGYYFWDNRDHGGNTGVTWGDGNFNLFRYKRNASYPAFAHCTLNEDFGNGNGTSGADHGTVNGALDWSDSITDEEAEWMVKLFVRNLVDNSNHIIVYADSATADITPRRLQNFHPAPGTVISYTVTHLQQTVQSGTFTYNGGIIVIPGVKIYRDTSALSLSVMPLNTYFRDEDGDGRGNPNLYIQAVTMMPGYVTNNLDCNDSDAYINPTATEICNGIDDNCNGSVDEGVTSVFYADDDHDGFGNSMITTTGCTAPPGYVSNSMDCNDANAMVNPASSEVCNALDDDCDAAIDEGIGSVFYYDSDRDGYGNINVTTMACSAPSGYVSNSTDCNDLNASVYPSAAELCNSVDDNCNGLIDDGVISAAVSPYGTVSVCKKVRVTLTANVTGTAISYQWKKNGNNISGATSTTYLTGENDAATFSVVVTASGGCTSASAGVIITRLANPTVSMSATGNLDICGIGNVTLKASANTTCTYQWIKDAYAIGGATTAKYKATQTGSYSVVGTNSSGCSTTAGPEIVISTCRESVDESDSMNDFVIAPNPNNGDFMVQFNAPVKAGELICVFDITGRKYNTIKTDDAASSIPVHLGNLQQGIYFLEWRTNDQTYTKKFVVNGN